MWASFWCRADQDVGSVHAEIMGHLVHHCTSYVTNLYLVTPNFSAPWTNISDLSCCRLLLTFILSFFKKLCQVFFFFSKHYCLLTFLCNYEHICFLLAGKFALWMIPQLFAYALNFPIQKFLQAQGKVLVMLWVSGGVLVLHTFFSWLLILKLEWGLIGAAITLNTSWWLIVIAQLLYILITKSDGAWSGFTWLAFVDLFGFVKLSLASAVMLWYFH